MCHKHHISFPYMLANVLVIWAQFRMLCAAYVEQSMEVKKFDFIAISSEVCLELINDIRSKYITFTLSMGVCMYVFTMDANNIHIIDAGVFE